MQQWKTQLNWVGLGFPLCIGLKVHLLPCETSDSLHTEDSQESYKQIPWEGGSQSGLYCIIAARL